MADWIEIQVLLGPRRYLSTSELIDIVREDGNVDALADYDLIDLDLDQESPGDSFETEIVPPDAAEILVLDALSAIEARSDVIGDRYPLAVDPSGVLGGDENPVYRFLCALVARQLVGSRSGIHKGARLFEVLTAVALKAYLGGEARAIGFPRRDGTGFRDCIRRLVFEIRDQLAVATVDIPGSIKDLGVDVVAWKAVDASPGNAVILAQCATGVDWTGKGVQYGPWNKIVKHAVPPMLAISFPFIPEFDSDGIEWELMCGGGGLPFHRVRLARLVDSAEVPDDALEEMIAWSDTVADLVFGLEPEGEIDSDEMLALDESEAEALDLELPALTV